MASTDAENTASIAGKNTPESLTSYVVILRLILDVFFSLMINGLQILRIITIMLKILIYNDFFIFQYKF